MHQRLATLNRQAGFTYFGVLAAIALLGAVMGATAEVWHTAVLREKESQLLFVGQQYRLAIERYYRNTPGKVKQFPPTLETLLEDQRLPGTQRYIRKVYRDPITGLAEWELLKDANGGITGLHSRSEAKPLKTAGFSPDDDSFANAERHSDWAFVARPDKLGRRSLASLPRGQ